MTPQFDAYTATVRGVDFREVLSLVGECGEVGLDELGTRAGFFGFETRCTFKHRGGDEWGAVQFGGRSHGDRVMVEVKGEHTPGFVETLRRAEFPHRCTRVDSCVDFEAPDAFDRTVEVLRDVKRKFGLRGELRGDWDFPEDGRTLMLGGTSSAARVRDYEKGKQPGHRHLERWGWVRTEVQVRPQDDARDVYSGASAMQVWGASPWTREVAARLLELQVPALPAGARWRGRNDERTLRALVDQYGQALVRMLEDHGDWACVGLQLGDYVDEARARAARRPR